jgi:type I restriction enzyme, S subunit
MVLNNLQKHWQVKKLGDIAKWGSGGTPTSTNAAYYGGNIPWLIIGDLNDSYITSSGKSITELGLKNSSAKIVKPDSVLVAMYGSIGKLGINKIHVATNQAIAFTDQLNDKINNKYLFHFLYHNRSKLHSLGKGGTQKNISQTVLKQVLIPFPPLSEQLSIVSKIEELLSDLENGKQQLQLAQQQLKIYRQSLLKWAFEGKLTNKSLNGELPKEWKLELLGTVLDKIEAGKSFKCDERTPKLDEVGVLKVSAVTWQIFNELESKTVIEKERINAAYYVKKNDFLFSRANTLDLIGAVVLVNNIERNLMLSDKTLRFIFNSNVLKSYILYYLRSKKGRNEIQRLSTGNQESMRNIGQERIKQIEFPLCSLEEQKHIVNELESRLTVCDKIEENISQSLKQADSLRQSILKKAFEGKLV